MRLFKIARGFNFSHFSYMADKKIDSTDDKVIRLTTRFAPRPPPPPAPKPPPAPAPKKSKVWLYTWIGIALLVALIAIYKIATLRPPIYIAMVSPMTSEDSQDARGMYEGIQLCVDEFNARGGIDGRRIELLTFDDQAKADKARERAIEIATQTNALGVVGHNTSGTSLAASPIYKENGIVAITGSATTDSITRDNEWYFRVIFNNSDQAALAANYIRKVLNHETANLIFSEDAFGKTLATSFIETAKSIGLTIENTWSFPQDKEDVAALVLKKVEESLKQRLEHQDKDSLFPMLFVATHPAEATEIVTSLHRLGQGQQLPIMGADPFSNDSFLAGIQRYPQERTRPGYFTEGLYMISPFLPDIANQKAQIFNDNFTLTYDHSPSMISAMNYDATLVLLRAIEQTVHTNQGVTDIKKLRKIVRDNLSSYSNVETGVEGITGDLYFDLDRNVVKTIPIGVFQEGVAINALEQFQPIPDLRRVNNLLEAAINNQIIHVNGKFMRRTQVVYAGIDFNELTDLNPKEGTFKADFYLWFRYRDNIDENKIDFVNAAAPIELGKPILDVTSDNAQGKIFTKTYRVRGKFKVNMDFTDYPFDKQLLSIQFRHASLTREKLIYAVDTLGLQTRRLGKEGILGKFIKNNVFGIGGWHVQRVSLFQNTKKNDSTLGMTESFGSQQRIEYSQFNANVEVQRLVLSFVLKNLLPIFFLIVLGYATFFIPIPTTGFPVRMALGTNMIVTTSLFHLRLASNMPDIDYIVLIEYVFYCVYLLALFSLGISIGSYFLGAVKVANAEKKIERLNTVGKIIYPLSLVLLIAYIIIFYR